MKHRIVIGITGASGSLYASKLLQMLFTIPGELHLVASDMGWKVLAHELQAKGDSFSQFVQSLTDDSPPATTITIHDDHDFFAPVASGSFRTSGMVIIPCSMKTLSAVATGCSDDLISRAADVTLKERRPLVLVTRETPLSLIHLKNMCAAAEAGATIMPASPGFYNRPLSIDAMAEHMAGRILDQLGIDIPGMARWGD
ncbi:MAG: UbiX family flavin prenyltransferase [Deltaproteobacteria bacterium]|nr:UbiX family flavin prenyltransferase [Deltaproteobacteria bacterium]